MEAFLSELLPRLLGDRSTFQIHVYQGKVDLLGKLEARLRGYAKWLPPNARIVVLVDRDDDDCATLKGRLERSAAAAALSTPRRAGRSDWRVVTRIAIEELEAWYFADWAAVRRAYPRVPARIVNQAPFRNSDAIAGGTWEHFERILKRVGYFSGGLRKIEAAREIGAHLDQAVCASPSFAAFRDALIEAAA